MRNYYKVLGVPESATDAEIRQAYRKLAALHHPDHNPHDPLAMDEMKMINEAYGVLSDPEKRSQYDRIHHFHDASSGPRSDGFHNESPGPQAEDIRSPSPAQQRNPFMMSADQMPRHPEDITNILWVVKDPLRNSVTPFMKRVLWIDVFVSIGYLIYYFTMRSVLPVMPPGTHIQLMYGRPMASWMAHFAFAAYFELITSIIAIYWMKRTENSLFLKPYLLFQCYLNVSVAAAFFGLTTIETSMLVPTTVILWKAFLIASLFISRVDRYLWGPR